MGSIRGAFESALVDWESKLASDEWYFAKVRDSIIHDDLQTAQAFEGMAEIAELLLTQEDGFLVTETMVLLLDLARYVNTTELPAGLAGLMASLDSHVARFGEHPRQQMEELRRWFRVGAT